MAGPLVKVYYAKPILPDVSRVLACLYEKEIDFNLIDIYEDQLRPPVDFLKLQSRASTRIHGPAFEDGRTKLFESRAICRYLAEKYANRGNKSLLGRDSLERVSIEQWLKSEENNFDPPSWTLVYYLAFAPSMSPLASADHTAVEESKKKLGEVLDVYEQRLGESKFLAGNEFTLADLSHLPHSHYLARSELFTSRDNVSRWLADISDRPSWKKVAGILNEVPVQRVSVLAAGPPSATSPASHVSTRMTPQVTKTQEPKPEPATPGTAPTQSISEASTGAVSSSQTVSGATPPQASPPTRTDAEIYPPYTISGVMPTKGPPTTTGTPPPHQPIYSVVKEPPASALPAPSQNGATAPSQATPPTRTDTEKHPPPATSVVMPTKEPSTTTGTPPSQPIYSAVKEPPASAQPAPSSQNGPTAPSQAPPPTGTYTEAHPPQITSGVMPNKGPSTTTGTPPPRQTIYNAAKEPPASSKNGPTVPSQPSPAKTDTEPAPKVTSQSTPPTPKTNANSVSPNSRPKGQPTSGQAPSSQAAETPTPGPQPISSAVKGSPISTLPTHEKMPPTLSQASPGKTDNESAPGFTSQATPLTPETNDSKSSPLLATAQPKGQPTAGQAPSPQTAETPATGPQAISSVAKVSSASAQPAPSEKTPTLSQASPGKTDNESAPRFTSQPTPLTKTNELTSSPLSAATQPEGQPTSGQSPSSQTTETPARGPSPFSGAFKKSPASPKPTPSQETPVTPSQASQESPASAQPTPPEKTPITLSQASPGKTDNETAPGPTSQPTPPTKTNNLTSSPLSATAQPEGQPTSGQAPPSQTTETPVRGPSPVSGAVEESPASPKPTPSQETPVTPSQASQEPPASAQPTPPEKTPTLSQASPGKTNNESAPGFTSQPTPVTSETNDSSIPGLATPQPKGQPTSGKAPSQTTKEPSSSMSDAAKEPSPSARPAPSQETNAGKSSSQSTEDTSQKSNKNKGA